MTLKYDNGDTVVGYYGGAECLGIFDGGLPHNVFDQIFLEDGEGTRYDTRYRVDTATGEYIALSSGDPPVVRPLPAGFPATTLAGAETFASNARNGTAFSRAPSLPTNSSTAVP